MIIIILPPTHTHTENALTSCLEYEEKREKSRAFFPGGDERSGWGPGFPLRTNIKKWGCEIKKEAKLNKPKCVRINPRAPLSLNGSPLKRKARLFILF